MDNFESDNSGKKEDFDVPIPFNDNDTSEAPALLTFLASRLPTG